MNPAFFSGSVLLIKQIYKIAMAVMNHEKKSNIYIYSDYTMYLLC